MVSTLTTNWFERMIAHLCSVSGFWKNYPQAACSCGSQLSNTNVTFKDNSHFIRYKESDLSAKVYKVKTFLSPLTVYKINLPSPDSPEGFISTERSLYFRLDNTNYIVRVFIFDAFFRIQWWFMGSIWHIVSLEDILNSSLPSENKLPLLYHLHVISNGIHFYEELI